MKQSTNTWQITEEKTAWFMMGPAVSGLLIFLLIPFCVAFVLAFTSYRLDSPLSVSFVGHEQFRRIFTDPAFLRALTNNLLFAVIVVPVQTILALILALLLNQRIPGMTFYRSLFFLPVIFPMALVAIVWELIYAPGPSGLFNSFLGMISGGVWDPVDFLNNPLTAMPAIMILSIWQGVGFQVVIILAGLQSIPRSLYEAAEIDGAGPWKRFIHVTLPGIRNTLIFVSLITTILAFRLFDQVWILTQGGPHNTTTTVMFEAIRLVFKHQDVARGSAMTVVFFVIVLALTVLQRKLVREERG